MNVNEIYKESTRDNEFVIHYLIKRLEAPYVALVS